MEFSTHTQKKTDDRKMYYECGWHHKRAEYTIHHLKLEVLYKIRNMKRNNEKGIENNKDEKMFTKYVQCTRDTLDGS